MRFLKINSYPYYFLDISTNAFTKEVYLSKGCQARIRGYLAKAEQGLKSSSDNHETITSILSEFRVLLKENKYNGHYFDRSASKNPICDSSGIFHCEGRFDENECKYSLPGGDTDMKHSINPYESSEARILFSTWNLDHV